MADNPTVDNGALTDIVVAADEITSPYTGGSAQAQAVKLIDGTVNANTIVAAGSGVAANALRVTVATDVGLPAGSNAIGKLAANSGVDIGDVDITSVVPGVAATQLGKAEDAAHTSGDTGVMALAVRKDTAVALAGADGDYIPLITDGTGRLWVSVGAIPASDVTTDSIGAAFGAVASPASDMTALSAIKIISAATTNSTSVKGSAGQLYWLHVINLNAAVRYLKLYNKATAPTVGTDVPVHTFAIPANTAGAGFVLPLTVPLTFATGIGLALTTGVADNDSGAVAANEIIVNGGYA